MPRGALNALGMVSLGDGDGDDNGTDADVDTYLMAKSYFDLKEYDRCRFFTEASKDPKIQFLHFYSWYLSGEKKRLDNQTDTIPSMGVQQQTYLKELRGCLQKLHQQKVSSGICLSAVFEHLKSEADVMMPMFYPSRNWTDTVSTCTGLS